MLVKSKCYLFMLRFSFFAAVSKAELNFSSIPRSVNFFRLILRSNINSGSNIQRIERVEPADNVDNIVGR